jgi:hypothetical protein
MTEPRRANLSLGSLDDARLASALRELGTVVDFPIVTAGATDLAATARLRIVGDGVDRRGRTRIWSPVRPFRRALVLALVALLVLATIAAGVAGWLPGIRIRFGDGPSPSATPSLTAGVSASPSHGAAGTMAPLGSVLGLGTHVSLDEAERVADIELLLPGDAAIGPPDAAFVDAGRVSLVWGARPGLREDSDGIALLISEFRGSVGDGYYDKVLGAAATITPVSVNGDRGYFIGGAPHFFMYVDDEGRDIDASHRVVGNVVMWAHGEMTYRLEADAPMAEAIRLAETLR